MRAVGEEPTRRNLAARDGLWEQPQPSKSLLLAARIWSTPSQPMKSAMMIAATESTHHSAGESS